jgi:hypothetical protein
VVFVVDLIERPQWTPRELLVTEMSSLLASKTPSGKSLTPRAALSLPADISDGKRGPDMVVLTTKNCGNEYQQRAQNAEKSHRKLHKATWNDHVLHMRAKERIHMDVP